MEFCKLALIALHLTTSKVFKKSQLSLDEQRFTSQAGFLIAEDNTYDDPGLTFKKGQSPLFSTG